MAPSDFRDTGHRAWILGHIHVPHRVYQQPHVFYCGSLQGLDPSENDLRGATIMDMDAAGNITTHFLPLAPLLWHHQEIHIEGDKDVKDVELLTFMEKNVQETLQKTFQEDLLGNTRIVMSRFFIRGRVKDYHKVLEHTKQLEGTHHTSIFCKPALIPSWVEKVILVCKPALDLSLLAQGEDLVAQLARRILSLQNSENASAIIAKARAFVLKKEKQYPHLATSIDEETIRSECLRAAYVLLDVLLKQKEQVKC